MTAAVNAICIVSASFFAMRFVRAEKMYLIGMPLTTALIYILLILFPQTAFLGESRSFIALFIGLACPVLFEKKLRREALSVELFGFACFGTVLTLTGFMLGKAAELFGFSTPFKEIFAFLALMAWCGAMSFAVRFFPSDDWRSSFKAGCAEGESVFERFLKFYLLMVIWTGVSIACALDKVSGIALLAASVFVFFAGLALILILLKSGGDAQAAEEASRSLDDLRDFMYTLRSQRHDYNFHLHTMRGLINSGQYEKCAEYMDEIAADTTALNELLPIADPAVSAVIYSFRTTAAEKGIGMDIEILNDMSSIATGPYETNSIIGNLLQNAIDASEKLADRSFGILLRIFKKGEYCLISVSNKLEEDSTVPVIGSGISTKSGRHEGVGLMSVKLLTERYRGTVYQKIEDDVITTTAKIPLRVG